MTGQDDVARVCAGTGRWLIEGGDMEPIDFVLGGYAYLTQDGEAVIIAPEMALEISDKLARWAIASGAVRTQLMKEAP